MKGRKVEAMALSEPGEDCGRTRRPRGARAGLLALRSTLAFSACLAASASLRANQFVRMDFSLSLDSHFRSTAFIELFDDKPLTRDNFMQYVNGGHYDGMLMHRLARNFVLQGGGYYPEVLPEPPPVNNSLNPFNLVDLDGNPATDNPTVVNEYSVGTIRSNQAGTISMARKGGLPDSADSEWFVNYGNNSGLDAVDGGFNVFARVVGDGMSLLNVYNSGLSITNLNPDFDNNAVRDPGYPFGSNLLNGNPNTNDGVPFLGGLLLVLQDAGRVDYYGAGSTTNVPVGGLTIFARDAYFDTGAAFTGTGGWTIGAGRTLGIREGMSLTRNLNNLGTLAPGLDVGAITIQSYQQGVGGTLAIDLRGTTVDTHYDRLTVTGAASLAGNLAVELIAGYTPLASDAFTILTSTNLSGTFTGVANGSRVFTTGGAGSFTVTYDYALDKVVLANFFPAYAADFNLDGAVNAADLTAWRTAVSLGNAGADADNDGDSDGDDFLVWQRQLGSTTPAAVGAATAVPEPAPAILAIMFAGALRTRRRRAHLAPGTYFSKYATGG